MNISQLTAGEQRRLLSYIVDGWRVSAIYQQGEARKVFLKRSSSSLTLVL